jgi:hypothetical protein
MMRVPVSREARHTRTTIAMNIAFDVCEHGAIRRHHDGYAFTSSLPPTVLPSLSPSASGLLVTGGNEGLTGAAAGPLL